MKPHRINIKYLLEKYDGMVNLKLLTDEML